jgi:hypothetical protein
VRDVQEEERVRQAEIARDRLILAYREMDAKVNARRVPVRSVRALPQPLTTEELNALAFRGLPAVRLSGGSLNLWKKDDVLAMCPSLP